MDDFSIWVFLGLTVILFGGCAFLMGQAIADTWRPAWQIVPYGLLLAGGNHFLDAALFDGSWTDFGHYLLDAAIIVGIALTAHRATLARKMVAQYPWLYEPSGAFGWREKHAKSR